LHTLGIRPARNRRLACLIAALAAWYGVQGWAATVSTHPFGRQEILIQEGTPVGLGEILGTVRRQSGSPEYPLVLGIQKRVLELSILGPGNRPIRLASTPFTGAGGAGGPATRFIVERSVRQDEGLTLWVRQVNTPRQVGLTVDLRSLERMIEGPR
jgi:hypothetical protein